MGRISAAILGAIVGGFAAAIALVWFLGWGSGIDSGPVAPLGRADYVDFLGHQILGEMAQRGELDEVLERVANRMQGGELEAEEGDEEEGV